MVHPHDSSVPIQEPQMLALLHSGHLKPWHTSQLPTTLWCCVWATRLVRQCTGAGSWHDTFASTGPTDACKLPHVTCPIVARPAGRCMHTRRVNEGREREMVCACTISHVQSTQEDEPLITWALPTAASDVF